MKILFLGTLFQKSEEKNILDKSNMGLQNQANTFQWLLINGLDSILSESLDIINVLPVGTYPKQYKDIILKDSKWFHAANSFDQEIGSINLPFLKQIIRTIRCRKAIRKWIKINRIHEELHIIIYSTYLPFLSAVYHIHKKIKITLVVTDIPEYDDLTLCNNFVRKVLRDIYNKRIYASMDRINSFILLTDYMRNPLKIGDRPYIVIEGITDIYNFDLKRNISGFENNEKKIILYTGTLNYQFGIISLIKAFLLIDRSDYELWICGAGEAEAEIREIAQNDKRITCFGFLAKDKILELQYKATLLVNPRPNSGEYTKYSFPSKTMEYMASGKPVLMYKLDGIPEEYDKYLYYFENDDIISMKEKIIEICSKSNKELCEKGREARQWILNEKNNIKQSMKVIKMLESSNMGVNKCILKV